VKYENGVEKKISGEKWRHGNEEAGSKTICNGVAAI
jgi:hypothetical protein